MQFVKLFAFIFCILSASVTFVAAEDDFENLKTEAIAQFTKQANTSGSELANIIKKYNEDTVDGRNPDGTIKLPVTRADLRAVVVSGAVQYRPFHYAEVENGRCVTTGNSATVLIMLSTHQAEHLSAAVETLTFVCSVEEHLSCASKTNRSQDCQDEAEDARIKTVLQTSDFKQITINTGKDQEN
jgi:hypothetical protein